AKRCHLQDAHSDDAPAKYAGDCGWHKDWLYQGSEDGQMLDWKIPTNSKWLGAIDEAAELVYLHPEEAQAVAAFEAKRHNIHQSFKSIGRKLLNEGLCQAHQEGDKIRATAHVRLKNHAQARLLWIPIKHLFGEP